ncbi:carboxymuconolactone decarboxylase family protein [Xanthomonas sp. 1678]|uniref:carboxymuconolactone decarboxylase family protein n=1 Tax=Xanthomonas sp. 1678 TaxID=3158788 RepID=UPI002866EF74|nr:AhpD family alkylhydroperoxidase [Xanthomonas translucens]
MHFHRIDYTRHEPVAFRALLSASQQVHEGVLSPDLAELVFLRVSQLNGCSYCIDMHATALRKAGVEPRKLDTLAGWRESRFFDARERAALAWAEALTTLPSGAPADACYDALAAHFDAQGISALTMAIALINAWNRLGVGLQPAMP